MPTLFREFEVYEIQVLHMFTKTFAVFSLSIGILLPKYLNGNGSWYLLRVSDGTGVVSISRLRLQDYNVGLSKQHDGVPR